MFQPIKSDAKPIIPANNTLEKKRKRHEIYEDTPVQKVIVVEQPSNETKQEIENLRTEVATLKTEVETLKLQIQDQQQLEGQVKYFSMLYSLAKQEIDDLQKKQ